MRNAKKTLSLVMVAIFTTFIVLSGIPAGAVTTAQAKAQVSKATAAVVKVESTVKVATFNPTTAQTQLTAATKEVAKVKSLGKTYAKTYTALNARTAAVAKKIATRKAAIARAAAELAKLYANAEKAVAEAEKLTDADNGVDLVGDEAALAAAQGAVTAALEYIVKLDKNSSNYKGLMARVDAANNVIVKAMDDKAAADAAAAEAKAAEEAAAKAAEEAKAAADAAETAVAAAEKAPVAAEADLATIAPLQTAATTAIAAVKDAEKVAAFNARMKVVADKVTALNDKIAADKKAAEEAAKPATVTAVTAADEALTVNFSKAVSPAAVDFVITKAIGTAAATTVTPVSVTAVNETSATIKVPATIATTADQSVVYTVAYKGQTAVAATAYTVPGFKVTVKAIAANKIQADFSAAVDTTKATASLKLGYVPQDVTTAYAADGKSVVFTSATNFVVGTYTATVNGAEGTVAVVAQKIASFTIKTTQFLANAGAQALAYEAKDQYGQVFDYASTNFTTNIYNIVTPANGAVVANNGNAFTVTLGAPTVNDKFMLTIVEKTTGISQSATIPVVADAAPATFSFGTPVPKTDNARIYINEANADNMYIPFSVKDQYNNAMVVNTADYVFVSSNTAVVDPANFANYVSVAGGTNDSINFATGATAGTVTITAISKATGKTATTTFTVYDPAALKSVSMNQPTGLIVAGEATTINYTALDTFGAAAKLTAVGNLTWFSTNPAVVNTATDLAVDAKGVLTVTPTGAGSTVLSAFLGGVKQGEISLTVSAAKVETKITALSSSAIVYFAKNGGAKTYAVSDFTIVDQYNRVVSAPAGAITLAVKDATATTITAAGATLTAANNLTGSKVIVATYTNGGVTLTKEFTVNVVADSTVINYTLAAMSNTVLFGAYANVAAAGTDAKVFTISNGLDASGNKIALNPADAAVMTLTSSDLASVGIDSATGSVFSKADAKTAIVQVWKNGIKIGQYTFTTSTAAKAVTKLAFAETSYTVAVAATYDLATELTTNGDVLDQYGQTIALGAGTWFSSNTAVATVNPATGVVTGVAAGTATITFVAENGVNVTVTVVVE